MDIANEIFQTYTDSTIQSAYRFQMYVNAMVEVHLVFNVDFNDNGTNGTFQMYMKASAFDFQNRFWRGRNV